MIYVVSLLSLAASGVVAQTLTGQYSCATAGNYQLCQNLWGECTDSSVPVFPSPNVTEASTSCRHWKPDLDTDQHERKQHIMGDSLELAKFPEQRQELYVLFPSPDIAIILTYLHRRQCFVNHREGRPTFAYCIGADELDLDVQNRVIGYPR